MRIATVSNDTGRPYDRALRNRATVDDLIPEVAAAIINGDREADDMPSWWRVGVAYNGTTYLY